MKPILMTQASRPHTPMSHLSGWTWAQGPTAFFSQGVPFSYGVGPTLARRIWAAYRSVYPHGGVTGLEIGAGLGYLSKHCLDMAGADIVRWHVSDASTVLVDHWRAARTFSAHGHVVLQSLCLDLPFVWSGHVDLIVMSYVLDSTATCHLEWENGVLYEWVMRTVIEDKPIVVASREAPHTMLNVAATQVWDNWKDYTDAEKPWLAPRLSTACHETWERIPATQSRCLLPEDHALLTGFLVDKAAMRFNYPLMLRQRLPELMAALSDRGMIALHDFGYQSLTGAKNPEDLCSSFGAIQAYPLCFPLVAWMAMQSGLDCRISPAPEGESALCVLSKVPLPETWLATDAAHLQAHTLQAQLHMIDALDPILASHEEDYALMAHLALQPISATEKERLLQKTIAHYPDLAIPSYAQYAQLLGENGDTQGSITLLEDAVKRFPLDPNLAMSLGNLYVREKRFADALAVFQDVIVRLDAPVVWSVAKLMDLLTAATTMPKREG